MATSKTIQGPSLKIYMNGALFGVVKDVSWFIRTPHTPIRTIDNLMPVEMAPAGYIVGASMTIYRIHGDGGAEGQGLVPFPDAILLEKYVRIDIVDRKTDRVVFATQKAVLTSQDWQGEQRGLVTGKIVFEAIDASNEARQ